MAQIERASDAAGPAGLSKRRVAAVSQDLVVRHRQVAVAAEAVSADAAGAGGESEISARVAPAGLREASRAAVTHVFVVGIGCRQDAAAAEADRARRAGAVADKEPSADGH